MLYNHRIHQRSISSMMITDYFLVQKSLKPGEHNGVFKLTVRFEQKGKPTYDKSQHFVLFCFCFFFLPNSLDCLELILHWHSLCWMNKCVFFLMVKMIMGTR